MSFESVLLEKAPYFNLTLKTEPYTPFTTSGLVDSLNSFDCRVAGLSIDLGERRSAARLC